MSIYINCLNKFFKENKLVKQISEKKLVEISKKYNIGIYNILGILQNDQFKWAWSIPVDKKFDVVNEGYHYKYLKYGLSILRDDNMTESSYFLLYIRYILTKSEFNFKNLFEITIFLSILNHLKAKNNQLVILKFDTKKLSTDPTDKQKYPTTSIIRYDQIEINNLRYYYKIFEIPKKYLN
jgi:hypothetical protein